MNIAVTDGVVLTPTPFSEGLDVWSRGDGRPGSDTYASSVAAAYVPADADFGGCLELQKTDTTQKLRYMGQTPILPGVYLRVTARVKAISGNLPSVRIAGWAGTGNDVAVSGVPMQGDAVALSSYGEVVEVSAIVGAGSRAGVDLIWGTGPSYGHFGLDLTGLNGGVVRIDDLQIEDITEVFLRQMLASVDVRDYGALGDGSTDDSAAFEAADAAADGRLIIVPSGTYRLANSVTLEHHVRFEGQLSMPASAILSLTKDFNLPAYSDAFGGDEEIALAKGLQSLLNNADHESFDMGGRRVSMNGPLDVQAAVPNRDTYSQRRVLRNGQLRAEDSGGWGATSVTSTATYSASNQWRLTNVANVANIEVGSLVTGAGVGREIYVKSKNVGAQEITLSQPLSDAVGTQSYTFTRFRYMLDFSGFTKLEKFEVEDVEFQCLELASGLMLPPLGTVNVIRNCVFNRPSHRGITSIGEGCQGLLVDHNQFISAEGGLATQSRQSVAINTNANDVKIRNNRASQFRHFAVISGAQAVISGNHFFQGDETGSGIRSAGIVLCLRACSTTIFGNYIDNCFIEWTNEREPEPDFSGGFGFAGLSITGNVMLCSNVADWFSFIVVKPYGSGHMVNGMNVSGNLFRAVGGTITRVERVDTSFAGLELGAMRRVFMQENTFHNIDLQTENPLQVTHDQNTHAATWVVATGNKLPFGGRARQVQSLVLTSRPRNGANVTAFVTPYTSAEQGSGASDVHVIWPEPVLGDLTLLVRMDT
ncbi:glycosyl hydrolase family 28-related protein [Salipiger sp. PrR002]|uniref:glycosyl hydrolase family 28-related protein n=1 Tax=Salipiger sp. PrR002 TaxID=2706489 RepID=UPI0013B8BD44|nr:glycosyl hydrolase family 28-related protein [Salipiger sp. PrR002]NDV98604.1 right-handed parallel beta-helix repeat-containing protein [Salipiger sp. PrR002]NDW57440.1 right-handed parallel beta-helix repeat-containing protein [Salipiger sp. PrR004]